jgi:hypothetical protein
MQKLGKDKLFTLSLEDLPHGKKFLPYGEKIFSPCGNLSRTCTGLGAKQQTIKFNLKSYSGSLESSQQYNEIVQTLFYFMRLSL